MSHAVSELTPEDLVQVFVAHRRIVLKRAASMFVPELQDALASAVLNTELIARGGASPLEVAADVQAAIARVREVLDEWLRYAELREEPPDEPVSLDTVVRRSWNALPAAHRDRHRLLVTIEPRAQALHRAPRKIQEVLMSLLWNALDGAKAPRTIRLDARLAEAVVFLRVSDDGPGVPSERRANLFEPLVAWRSPSPTDGGTRGRLGLGLPLGRELMRELGGDLQLTDTADGSTFLLTIPLETRH